jgi:hypothetical protein
LDNRGIGDVRRNRPAILIFLPSHL